jgi:hypothetical protein
MRKLTPAICSLIVLSAMAFAQSKPPVSNTVYAVEKGKSYHKKNCKLKSGSKGMTLAVAKNKGFKPCKVCKPPK